MRRWVSDSDLGSGEYKLMGQVSVRSLHCHWDTLRIGIFACAPRGTASGIHVVRLSSQMVWWRLHLGFVLRNKQHCRLPQHSLPGSQISSDLTAWVAPPNCHTH